VELNYYVYGNGGARTTSITYQVYREGEKALKLFLGIDMTKGKFSYDSSW